VVRSSTSTRFIIDAKYINRPPSADEFYQILAYTISYGCDVGALALPHVGPRAPIEYCTDEQKVYVHFVNLTDPVQAEADLVTWLRAMLTQPVVGAAQLGSPIII
jgi:hypothetical protein